MKETAYKHRSTIMAVVITSVLSIQMVMGQDIWEKISDATQSIYKQVAGISTGILVLVLAIAMIMRMVSKNPRSIEIWTGWAKTAAISWIILNGLGFIMAYAKDFIGEGGVVGDNFFKP